MKFAAVIFDLDGTLLNSLEDLADSTNKALALHGFSEHSSEEYKLFIGNGMRQLIKNASPENTDDDKIEQILIDFRAIYIKNYINKTCPYNNIESSLRKLKEMGIRMSICSNKADKMTNEIVEKTIGKEYFDVVFGERDGVPKKPDPASLLEAAEIMKVNPGETIYIGDSGGDMISAKNAGMYAVGALWGFRSKEELENHGAQLLVSDPMELVDFISSNLK